MIIVNVMVVQLNKSNTSPNTPLLYSTATAFFPTDNQCPLLPPIALIRSFTERASTNKCECWLRIDVMVVVGRQELERLAFVLYFILSRCTTDNINHLREEARMNEEET